MNIINYRCDMKTSGTLTKTIESCLRRFVKKSAMLLSMVVWITAFIYQTTLNADQAKISVNPNNRLHQVSPMLWGIFFEDINLSADGGIYPELVRNRSFEDSSDKPDHWQIKAPNNVKINSTIDTSRPINHINRRSLKIEVPQKPDSKIYIENRGYWGMAVEQGKDYEFSLYARAVDDFNGKLGIEICDSNQSPIVTGEITGIGGDWKKFSLILKSTKTEPKAFLRLSFQSSGVLWLDMVSLMPRETWKNHGLRKDLCEMLDGLKPAFVRFPGGCWVEGDDLEHSYRWKNTIGKIEHRKPLWNLWQYYATHGLGFHEYLQMCEDLGAEPLFVINCGMSHREVVPMDQMGQWVQDALDAIEYANGPTNTIWGGLRALNGHPAPFNLKYIEIGNENGGPAYNERYALFYDAIKSRCPEIKLVANVWGGVPNSRPLEIIDEHYYSGPEFFIKEAERYDRYDRNGPKVYVGEYAVTEGCGQGNLRGAIGEAAFMIGMERNSDVVIMASYAPLFANVNYKRWNPDLINFDSSRVYGLPSYYVQQLFSQNRGSVVLECSVESPTLSENPGKGKIGLGTWLTSAEFKDIKVVKGDKVLFESDFSSNLNGWQAISGKWSVNNAACYQSEIIENAQIHAGDVSWSDYSITLKARKISGSEGFLIMFNVLDDKNWTWWNIGGWGNKEHGIEFCKNGGKSSVGQHKPGFIETGKWYDIRIDINGQNIKCWLDGQLIHDVDYPRVRSLLASAVLNQPSNELILKVVNAAFTNVTSEINLNSARLASKKVKHIVLTGDPLAENSLEKPYNVIPKENELEITGHVFEYSFPGNSLSIFKLKLSEN